MKNLNSISTSAFANSTINEFDAPKLVNIFDDEDVTFIVGKKSFEDPSGIL